MPTKTQAKAAIDNAATFLKNDIDTIPPAGVDIRDGAINFNPMRATMTFNAAGNASTAATLLASITANLATAGRAYTVTTLRRSTDGEPEKAYLISTVAVVYKIVNF